ncbi:hypothetical protein EDI_022260 [Entamoeba dispar SAW760]|uniref:Ras-GAP domain-containing protein n=1 Tax=Entamoeba dispar (strain ATCC PRA-260 / SAW760) TaxID=370354 RepID=B0EBW0_ENTDS|nr:uncharacterized protein EDI_022260 [Entamoeba dispar SAW760]EDR27980.1 hypothetical protein EDI_022260 [Entamoeba dispar SAW760]|eukprot:EDR27980.1 hypothetical protein EDI_022260 [Entamoeba dispar SAW760]
MKTTTPLPNGKKYQFDRLIFKNNSLVLKSYFDIIIQPALTPEVNTYSRLLVDYFVAHGNICLLFKQIAKHDIDISSIETKTFKGSSVLVRLYNEYANRFLVDFAKNSLQEVLQNLIFVPSIPHEQLITKLCEGIYSSLKTIPPHFIRSLQIINEEVENKQTNHNSTQWVFQQLFFVRFLFPLLENPLFILDGVKQDELNLSQKKINQFAHYFKQVVNSGIGNEDIISIVNKTIYYLNKPVALSIEQSGLDLEEQKRLHALIVQAFKDHQKDIINYLNLSEKERKEKKEGGDLTGKITSSFLSSIEPSELKMNEIEALNEANRLIYFYRDTYSQRIEEITKENIMYHDYLLNLQHRIQIITQQIEEEKVIHDKLSKELYEVEKIEQTSSQENSISSFSSFSYN